MIQIILLGVLKQDFQRILLLLEIKKILFNNGIIINWTTQALRDTTFTLPLAFTSTNYAFSGTIWIDQVVGISVTKQLTSVKFSSVMHGAWCNSGYIFMGY